MTIPAAKWPFGPLADVLGPLPVTEMARRLGVDRRSIYRWAHTGVPDRRADHVAIRLGFVPYAIWPAWLHGPDHVEPVEDWLTSRRLIVAERHQRQAKRRREARRTIARAQQALAPRPCGWCCHPFEPKHPSQRFCRMSCSEASRKPRPQSVDVDADAVTCGGGWKSTVNPHRSARSAPHPEQRSLEAMDQLNQEVA